MDGITVDVRVRLLEVVMGACYPLVRPCSARSLDAAVIFWTVQGRRIACPKKECFHLCVWLKGLTRIAAVQHFACARENGMRVFLRL